MIEPTCNDWPHYRTAVLHFGTAPPWTVPASEFAHPTHAPRRRALGLDRPFAIVTAFNPHPQRPHASANVLAHAELARCLDSLGLDHLACAGTDPAEVHREEGFAVFAAIETVLDLARRFGQAAVYWWDGASMWIEPTNAESTRERLDPDTQCRERGASPPRLDPDGSLP